MATRIKRYEERKDKLDQLLGRIEDEMGPQAQLETREFSRGRILGLFGGLSMIEIIATTEVELEPRQPAPQADQAPVTQQSQPQSVLLKPPPPKVVAEPIPHPTELLNLGEKKSVIEQVIDKGQRNIDIQADEPLQVPFVTESKTETQPAIDIREPVEVIPAAQFLQEQGSPQLAATPPTQPAGTVEAPVAPASQAALSADPFVAKVDHVETGVTVQPERAPSANDDLAEIKDTISELKQTISLLVAQTQSASPATPAKPAVAPVNVGVTQDLSMVNPLSIDPGTTFSGVQRNVFDQLLDWNIGPYDAIDLINTALTTQESPELLTEESLIQMVTRDICRNVLLSVGIQLNPTPPGKVVALVGATGVGKSTTIAKLAAHFAFQGGKRVSLVSLDNYRIAAAEQLRTYTDIMGIDLDIVFSKDEFDQVLTQRSHNDLILIDTAGRSPLHTKQIYELRDIFSAHPPDEVHLVVSASTKGDDVRTILENFEPLSYDHVIVSKLDETLSLGCIYNINKLCKMPISYFTIGQSVPEDIRTATLSFIQGWINQGRIL